jgi:hypothetical protein
MATMHVNSCSAATARIHVNSCSAATARIHVNSCSSFLDEVLGLHGPSLDVSQSHGFRGIGHGSQADSGDGSTT